MLLLTTSSVSLVAAQGNRGDGGGGGGGSFLGGGIITRDGGRFTTADGSSPFCVVGANCYYLVYFSTDIAGSKEQEQVTEVLDISAALGLNVIRTWAFNEQWGGAQREMQTSPGVYNERFLLALDAVIVEASKRGLRLLLCLTNYWEDYGAWGL